MKFEFARFCCFGARILLPDGWRGNLYARGCVYKVNASAGARVDYFPERSRYGHYIRATLLNNHERGIWYFARTRDTHRRDLLNLVIDFGMEQCV